MPFVSNINGFSSVGRALVSKTRCREFESLNPCKRNNMLGILKYFRESFEELKNHVSWPSFNEGLELTVLVAVFSVIFSLVIWALDSVFSKIIKEYFNLLS